MRGIGRCPIGCLVRIVPGPAGDAGCPAQLEWGWEDGRGFANLERNRVMKHNRLNRSEYESDSGRLRAWRLPADYFPLARSSRGEGFYGPVTSQTIHSRQAPVELEAASEPIEKDFAGKASNGEAILRLTTERNAPLGGEVFWRPDLIQCSWVKGKCWMLPLIAVLALANLFIPLLPPGRLSGSNLIY